MTIEHDLHNEPIFEELCGEYVLKIENDKLDELWLEYLRVRADPQATRKETTAAGNDFVKQFNRLGISANNPNEE